MEKETLTIEDLSIGCRLIYRSKQNWRMGALARKDDEIATLTICSPTGRTYRLRRKTTDTIRYEGSIAILDSPEFAEEAWRDNFGEYDQRW